MTTEFGRYTLLDKLGNGGMGAVYKAWDPQRNAHVAIKCMLEADDPVELKRFLREASTATSLSHANICTVCRRWKRRPRSGCTAASLASSSALGRSNGVATLNPIV